MRVPRCRSSNSIRGELAQAEGVVRERGTRCAMRICGCDGASGAWLPPGVVSRRNCGGVTMSRGLVVGVASYELRSERLREQEAIRGDGGTSTPPLSIARGSGAAAFGPFGDAIAGRAPNKVHGRRRGRRGIGP